MNPIQHFQTQATRRTFLGTVAIIALAIANVSSPARADRQDDFKKLEAGYKAAEEKFVATRKEKPTPADFIRNYEEWPVWEYVPRFVALAEADPTDDTAFQCCQWVFDHGGSFSGDGIQFTAEQKAWPLIAAHHATGDHVPKLCLDASDAAAPAREQFLRDLLKEPNLSKRDTGYATLALASLLVKKIDFADYLHKKHRPPADDELFNHLQSRYDPAFVKYTSDINVDACKAESAQLLRTVIDHYADVPTTYRHMPTLGDNAKQSLYALEHLSVGAEAPAIVGQDLEGRPLKLDDYRGRVVVLSFWFTGCGPCMAMIPEERKLKEKLKERPFSLLGICGDRNRDEANKTVADEKITWTCWFDGGHRGPIARDYNVMSWPTFFLIDQNGRIANKDVDGDHLEGAVAELLDKSKRPENSNDASPAK